MGGSDTEEGMNNIVVTDRIKQVFGLLMLMEDQERETCFEQLKDKFCIACGSIQPPRPARRCQCWNDE